MRTVIVSNIVSVDGSYEGPGGDVMALNMDAAFDAYNLERIRAAGTVLLGRRSFEGFSSYWPNIATAPHDPADRGFEPVAKLPRPRGALVSPANETTEMDGRTD